MSSEVYMQVPKVLLPKPECRKKWAVVACDQFTSEPEYWANVKKEVGSEPSMLNLILPELYLDSPEEEKMIEDIKQTMDEYLKKDIFTEVDACIYVERKTRKVPCRRGVIMALDLEAYDWNAETNPTPIRPTEMTVVERIPPRLRVRSKALIESPHILVLIDDPNREIIEPLTAEKEKMEKLYDEELLLGAGHITGYKIPQAHVDRMVALLKKLGSPKVFNAKYGVPAGTAPLLYAVGDGNHSLATAKQNWENIKKTFTDPAELQKAMESHPARYCMVEVSNIFDEGIEFEGIHRVLFGCKSSLLTAFQQTCGADNVTCQELPSMDALMAAVENPPSSASSQNLHSFGLFCGGKYLLVTVPAGSQILPVGTVQTFLDTHFKGQFSKIDYIHGASIVEQLVKGAEDNIGILLPTMAKSLLFPTVIRNARLPRKTFSMGEADEKRFYFECRRIVP